VDEFTYFTNCKSFIIWGEYQEITDLRERYRAMNCFVDHKLPLKISDTAILPEHFKSEPHRVFHASARSIMYRLVIFEKSGRYETS
jgi:hypothetical protein